MLLLSWRPFPPPPDVYQALVCLQCPGGGAGRSLCLEGPSGTAVNQLVLGRVLVTRSMRWAELTTGLNQIFTSYLQTVCGDASALRGETRLPLGLGPGSISTIRVGEDAFTAQLLQLVLDLRFNDERFLSL